MKNTTIAIFMLLVGIIAKGQDYAQKQLNESPRHHEWVKVSSSDERDVHCFVAFPEKSEKTLAVIVIHENRGLTDWVRSFADQLAKAGYLAIAPDLLSNFSDEYKRTSSFPSPDEARDGIYQLDPDQVTRDLNAVFEYVKNISACNGNVIVAGFCWGGSQSFRYATNNKELKAAMVFYGSAPKDQKEIERISVPVYGFYGENDNRINSGIPDTETMMKKGGKTYHYEIYKGAGHAYMRRGDDPEGDEANVNARNDSWKRILKILTALW